MRKTGAKRRHSTKRGYQATTAGRALTKFWKDVAEESGWGKDDILVIGIMPIGLPERKRGATELPDPEPEYEDVDEDVDEDVEDEDDEDEDDEEEAD